MKFSLLLIGLLSVFAVSAQSADRLSAYFINKKLLTEEQLGLYRETQKVLHAEIDSLTKTIKKGGKRRQQNVSSSLDWLDVKPEDDTLSALAKFLMVTSRQAIMIYPGWNVSFQDSPSTHQVAAESLQSFSAALFQVGTISRSEWKALQDAIEKKETEDSLSVVMKAILEKGKTTVFRSARFAGWLKQLATAGFLTPAKADSLSLLAENGELRSLYTVLLCSPQAVVIDLNDYPADPDQYMKTIHEKVASLLPDLQFDSFQYHIEINTRESFRDYTSYQAVVNLWQKGKKYSMASFYSPPNDSLDVAENFGKIGDEFYQVFNKLLRDRQSPLRLFSALASESKAANYSQFAILALTQEQANTVRDEHLLQLSNENLTLPLTSSAIGEAIEHYRQIGLLSHLTPTQIDSAIAVISQIEINHYGDILSQFPNLIFEIDLEYGVDKGQYREVTKDIAAVSRGHFKPEAIVDGYDYRKRQMPFVYGFTLNKKVYRTRLTQEDDWLDPGFWELIEKAVKEQDKKGRFHTVYPNDGLRVIYLTHDQYRVLKEKRLLEFEPVEDE